MVFGVHFENLRADFQYGGVEHPPTSNRVNNSNIITVSFNTETINKNVTNGEGLIKSKFSCKFLDSI